MSKHRIAILLLAVAAVSALAFGARADAIVPDDRVAVLVLPAPEGFSDGGDRSGRVAVLAQPAPEGFSRWRGRPDRGPGAFCPCGILRRRRRIGGASP